MDTAEHDAATPARGSRALGVFESALGLAFSGFLSLLWLFPGLYVLAGVKSRHAERVAAMWIAWAASLVLLGFSFRFYARSLNGASHPVPISIALRQRRWPSMMKPVVALWWLAIGAGMVLGAEWVIRQYAGFREDQKLVRYAATVGVLFASAVAANTYLLLAVAAVARSPGLLRAIWRGRIVVDLAAAFLLPLAPLPW